MQPIIEIQYLNGQSTLRNKNITIRVYKYVDINLALEAMLNSTNTTMDTFSSLLSDYKNNNSKVSSDAKTTLSNMWITVSSSGNLKKETIQTYENLNISFTTPNETAEASFNFFDLSIQFQDYGKYQLMFIVDGIESSLSGIIEITQQPDVVTRINVNNEYFF